MSRTTTFTIVLVFVLLGAFVAFFALSPEGQSVEAVGQSSQSQSAKAERTPDVIFVPTPQEVVEVMLRLANIDEKSVVYDLGSGDGRLVITAAQKYGARGVGIDIDPQRIRESNANLKKAGVQDRVKFLQQDLFETDISEATAVTLYLLPSLNVKLRPKLFRELRPGTPIVSHDFDMGDWKPEKTVAVKSTSREHTVYYWTIPAQVSGEWRWRSAGEEYRLSLAQSLQNVTGSLTLNGREMPITNGVVQGDKLTFKVATANSGTRQFTGHVIDGSITGQVTYGASQQHAWKAKRVSQAVAGL